MRKNRRTGKKKVSQSELSEDILVLHVEYKVRQRDKSFVIVSYISVAETKAISKTKRKCRIVHSRVNWNNDGTTGASINKTGSATTDWSMSSSPFT